jgi:hypothetical protein
MGHHRRRIQSRCGSYTDGTLGIPSIIPEGKVGQGQFSESTDDPEGYSQTLPSLETTSMGLVGELCTG